MKQSPLDRYLTTDPKDLSWEELANLTHKTQVEQFNFCLCEDIADDQDTPYADCPSTDGTLRHCGQVAEWADCEKCGTDALCYRVLCHACGWTELDCDTNEQTINDIKKQIEEGERK